MRLGTFYSMSCQRRLAPSFYHKPRSQSWAPACAGVTGFCKKNCCSNSGMKEECQRKDTQSNQSYSQNTLGVFEFSCATFKSFDFSFRSNATFE
jgi:hypothetical protein